MNRRLSCLALAVPLLAAGAGRAADAAAEDAAGPEGAREALVAGRTLAAWVADLADADAAVRGRAARALGAAGPEASAAVPALLRCRDDPDPAVKAEAVAAVCRIGGRPAREMVRGILLPDNQGRKVPVPIFPRELLQKAGPAALPPLFELLTDAATQAPAAAFLGPDGVLAVPWLLDQLAHGDAPTRAATARALALIKPTAPGAAAALKKALDDPDGVVRVRAAAALWVVDDGPRTALPLLTAALGDAAGPVRQEAADALGQLGPAAAPAARDLATALKDGDNDLSAHADAALRAIGPDALPAVIADLDDRAAPHRDRVFGLLLSFGPAAKDAVPALQAALDGPDLADRVRAAEVLLALAPDKAKDAVPTLVIAAESDDPVLVRRAAWLAQQAGPAAADVAPALRTALHHPDISVRLAAADALARTDRKNAPAVLPALTDALLTLPAEGRRAPLATLTSLGPDARPAAPALAAALEEEVCRRDDDSYLVRPLVRALVKIGAGADAVPPLVRLLGDPDAERRTDAVECLFFVGKDARAAVPALRAAARDKDQNVRELARDLLRKLTGEAVPAE